MPTQGPEETRDQAIRILSCLKDKLGEDGFDYIVAEDAPFDPEEQVRGKRLAPAKVRFANATRPAGKNTFWFRRQ